MIAYKLMRKMKDGNLAPLFINKKSRIPIGKWLEAENHPTQGFAERKGWHCTLTPVAPHLSEKGLTAVSCRPVTLRPFDGDSDCARQRPS